MSHNSRAVTAPAASAVPTPERNDSLVPALFLALGTFAIGTEGFMIAPLLSTMAADFGMTVPHIALLVVVFTLTMAVSSPVATVMTARLRRRNVLLFAMTIFGGGNLLAAWSPSFGLLMAARVMMAVASGLYVPNANALAGAIVSASKRGRALAIVSGGMTLAIALGLPLGGVVGHAFGWRATFLAVGAMSLTAIAGILVGVARDAGAGIPVATLSQRLSIARQPAVVRLLSVSLFWSIGAYAAYPYIAAYLSRVLEFDAVGINATVSMWGLAAAVGVTAGGTLTDKFGSSRVARYSLFALALSFWALALSASTHSAGPALLPVLAAIAVWGFAVWAFFPAQMSRLMAAGSSSQAPLSLALNTSTMYFGFSIGSAIGAAILATEAIWGIGLFAGACEMVALVLNRHVAQAR